METKRILIVDDDSHIICLVKSLLCKLGVRNFISAHDGLEGPISESSKCTAHAQPGFFLDSVNQRNHLILNGAPKRIRTSNLLIRSQML